MTFPTCSPATALLVFLSAAARAGVVPAELPSRRRAGIALPHPLHDVRRRPALAKLLRHELHVRIDVVKKHLVARAQVVQSLFAIGRANEAVLGALAVTSEAYLALATITRQRIELVLA